MTCNNLLLVMMPMFWPKMPPLGLGYLQAYLARHGTNAEILDLNNVFYNLADDNLKRQWLISCNVFLEENILNILRERHAGEYRMALERMADYDTVAFSCFKSNIRSSLDVAGALKKKKRDIKVIFGGPEITRQYLKGGRRLDSAILTGVDFAVAGEGEKPLCDYLEGMRGHGDTAAFEQLDDLKGLPFPLYSGLDLSGYPSKDAVPLQFSRGCVRECAFCSERLLFNGFRVRSTDSVIEEIKYHRAGHARCCFVFFDSLINGNLAALEELCDRITDSFGAVSWEAQMAIRSDMPERILEKMKRSGCYHLFIGLESGSDRVLKNMRKGFTAKEASDFFAKLNRAGLSFGVSIIVGYPQETEADFQETLGFLIRNKAMIPKIEQVNPFTYYAGTHLEPGSDYKTNKDSCRRLEMLSGEIKRHNFKFTSAFLGNLMEKDARV